MMRHVLSLTNDDTFVNDFKGHEESKWFDEKTRKKNYLTDVQYGILFISLSNDERIFSLTYTDMVVCFFEILVTFLSID